MSSLVKTDTFIIRTLTNLHAGSGDTNYGIIDKEVQRDPIQLTPVVHSSGIKGAFRESFAYHLGGNDAKLGNKHTDVVRIFGADNSARNSNEDKLSSGSHQFLEARLLTLPMRSNFLPFFRATSPMLLENFLNDVEMFAHKSTIEKVKTALDILIGFNPLEGAPFVFNQNGNEPIFLEDFKAERKNTKSSLLADVLGGNLAIFHDKDLQKLTKQLPVIARNHLENGISQNLWYEEVVPRETRFYTFVIHPADDTHFADILKDTLKNRLQIGANASIGYGQCEFTSL